MSTRSHAQGIRMRRYACAPLVSSTRAHRAYAGTRSLYAGTLLLEVTPSGNAAPALRPGADVPLRDGAADMPPTTAATFSVRRGQGSRGPDLTDSWPTLPDAGDSPWISNPSARRNRLTGAVFAGPVPDLCLSPGRPSRRPEVCATPGDRYALSLKRICVAHRSSRNFCRPGALGAGEERRFRRCLERA